MALGVSSDTKEYVASGAIEHAEIQRLRGQVQSLQAENYRLATLLRTAEAEADYYRDEADFWEDEYYGTSY